MPSVLQARGHMYVILLRIVREHAASKDCSSVLALAAKRGAIADLPLPWMGHSQRKPSALQSCLLCPPIPTITVLLAWAIVESEKESYWRFFVSNLCAAIPEDNHSAMTIMSDRAKGLQAAGNEMARAACEICVDHLSHSVQKNFGVPSRAIFNSPIRFALTETSSGRSSIYLLCPLFVLLTICFALYLLCPPLLALYLLRSY